MVDGLAIDNYVSYPAGTIAVALIAFWLVMCTGPGDF